MQAKIAPGQKGKKKDIKTAISLTHHLYDVAQTMSHIEAGEFPEDILSPKFKAFISSLDIDQYGTLLGLYGQPDDMEDTGDWLERAQRLANSLTSEQLDLYSRI